MSQTSIHFILDYYNHNGEAWGKGKKIKVKMVNRKRGGGKNRGEEGWRETPARKENNKNRNHSKR